MVNTPRDDVEIVHNEAKSRFETTVDGHHAVLDYRLSPGTITFTHTGVPRAIGGRGIAATLVRAGLDHARAAGLKVRPACSYVDAFMRRHRAYEDLRA